MRVSVGYVLLVLAASASAGAPLVADIRVLSSPSIPYNEVPRAGLFVAVEPGAAPEGQYVYAVCGNTLRRLDRNYPGRVVLAASSSGAASVARGMPMWKQAGVYTLEFAAAGLGTLFAEACGLTTIEGVYQAGWNGPGSVPGAAAFCLTSAVLSAGGTHLVGKLFGRSNTFKRALAGGAVGGLLGGAAFVDYFVTRRNPHSVMLPIGLLLPPLCTVIIYNVWRDDGTK